MRQAIRFTLVIGGILTLGLAVGFAWQMPWAISLWLWPDGPLSYLFIASMQAAIAAAMIWIGLSGELGALPAGALNLVVMMSGLAIYFFQASLYPDRGYLMEYAIGCGLFVLFNTLLFFWSRTIPILDPRPTPWPVRISFAIFIVVLVAVGTALILKTPRIFPWPLNPDSSVVFGWMFLGDAFYFLYALLTPRWQYARAQLWSFLAYDLVLIGPFIRRFAVINPALNPEADPALYQDLLNSLTIYTAVLIYSGLLAIYYLLLNSKTRAAWSER